MSGVDSLKARLKDVHHYPLVWTQAKAVNSLDEAADIVLKYNDHITAAAKKWGVPKEMIQAIIYREQATLGVDDTLADGLVMNYHTKGFGQPDCSTGIGQIFAKTAIRTERYFNQNCPFDENNPDHIWAVWKKLHQDPNYNIEHIAMTLKMEAYNLKVDLERVDILETRNLPDVRSVLAKYNGTGDSALRYGCDTVAYIPIFKNYNLGRDDGVDWNMRQQVYAKSNGPAVTVDAIQQNDPNLRAVNATEKVAGQSLEAQKRFDAIQSVEPRPNISGTEKLLINEVREYGIQAKAIIEREGRWPGRSADVEIAKKMAGAGYSQLHVAQALLKASPEMADKTYEQAKQYGQEVCMTPEVQQALPHRGHSLH